MEKFLCVRHEKEKDEIFCLSECSYASISFIQVVGPSSYPCQFPWLAARSLKPQNMLINGEGGNVVKQ